MKRTAAFFALAAAASGASADELVLKDGKKIEWVVLRDLGDEYEVETAKGTKITVRKDDVEGLARRRAEAPLTGASFTFDKRRKLETVNLLAKVDPKRDSVTDGWRRQGASLTGTGDGIKHSRIEVPGVAPEEYDLTCVVERRSGDDEFFVGLVGGGNQFAAYFDWARGSASGIGEIAGADAAKLKIPGRFFENGKQKTLVFMVRKEGVVVRADGKDWLAWRADWGQVSVHDSRAVRSKNVISLGVGGAGCAYVVSHLSISSPKS